MTDTPVLSGRHAASFGHCAVIGAGRLGTALVTALGCDGPFGRGFDGHGYDVVLLCVPDAEIASAAAVLASRDGLLVGHCSGATGLDVLAPHEAFGLHPLMTVPRSGAAFAGAGAVIGATTARGLDVAHALAGALGLQAEDIDDADRAAYHAAASIASNLLVALESAAEELLATTGIDRAVLVPLVEATVANWAREGARDALTGPIARGDDATVERQRAAIAERTPELLDLYDVLATQTRRLAAAPAGVA